MEHASNMGRMINTYNTLVGKPEEKKPRRRWEDNTKTDVNDIRNDDVQLINVVQDRLQRQTIVSTVISLTVI